MHDGAKLWRHTRTRTTDQGELKNWHPQHCHSQPIGDEGTGAGDEALGLIGLMIAMEKTHFSESLPN
jgi:hypothetical protein